MKVQQISLFLENSPGRLRDAARALAQAGVQVKALCLVDTGGFGVLRVIASDIVAARRIMMEKQWPAQVDEVVAAEIGNAPEGLAQALEPLVREGIQVEYMYPFSGPAGKPTMIFRFSDNDRAIAILERRHAGAVAPRVASTSELTH